MFKSKSKAALDTSNADNSISGKGKPFGKNKKSKRKADAVASMAKTDMPKKNC